MKPETYSEAEYIADNYGSCVLLDRCTCLRPDVPWLGRGCPSWRPIKAKTFAEVEDVLNGLTRG